MWSLIMFYRICRLSWFVFVSFIPMIIITYIIIYNENDLIGNRK